MNCNTCRYELSQCLDGRLPSGRRTVVMEHVEGCGACSTFWRELQAAQQLVLQLPRETVGDNFREQLWERIRAGEGTPEAVFHEPIPFAVKIRYALAGAAAAAVVLVGVLLLRQGDAPRATGPRDDGPVADAAPNGLRPRSHDGQGLNQLPATEASFAADPLLASTQRLTPDLVALEAARQLERRYATLHHSLGQLQDRRLDTDTVVEQVLDNAGEFESLGDLLLEMNDRRRLHFVDQEVGTDLRLAVGLLGQTKLLRHDQDTVTAVVGRALQSRRLGNISGMISLVPMDPREEREMLVRLNILRPEVFPKLFFVFGNDAELQALGLGTTFAMDDACGTSWVAPRSTVEAHESLLRWARARSGPGAGPVEPTQFQPLQKR